MKIGRGVSKLWGVEKRHLPLTWPMAYTTACTTVQAVICESESHESTATKFCMLIVIHNVITHACFGEDWLRVLGVAWSHILGFPIDLHSCPTSVSTTVILSVKLNSICFDLTAMFGCIDSMIL